LSLALAALLGSAVLASAAMVEDTVAVVNNDPIMLSEFKRVLAGALSRLNQADPMALADPKTLQKLREQTLDQLIDEQLLFQEGKKLDLKVHDSDIDNQENVLKAQFMPADLGTDSAAAAQAHAQVAFKKWMEANGITYEDLRKKLSRDVMVNKVIETQVKTHVKDPSDKEVKAYFSKVKDYLLTKSTEPPAGMSDEGADAFMHVALQVKQASSERVRLSDILIRIAPQASKNEVNRAKETAQAIYKELQDGTSSFAEIAKSESEDPESAARGGDLGWAAKGELMPELDKQAFSLPVGEISKPVFTPIGYHIVRVEEKGAAQPVTFDRFKDYITRVLKELSGDKALQDFISGLKSKAVIEKHLPPV
jgi:parvulin-like peptidyl-prolyl isomerase